MNNGNKIEVKLKSVSQLKALFEKRIFAIPKLQREFVWNSKKAAELMDSIYKNYPIGTILIWKVVKTKQFELNQHPSALPMFNAKGNKYVYFIIDGQQRLSVIYRILQGDTISNYRKEEINFGNIFFLLGNKEKRFKYLKQERDDTASVSKILSHNWKNKFSGFPGYALKDMSLCRERIYNYKVPVIFVSGFDLDEIKQTFIRINSLGTPISSADQAFTLASNFNLKDRIQMIYKNIHAGYVNMPKEIILRTIVLLWAAEMKGKRIQPENLQFGMEEINNFSKKLDKDKETQKKFNLIWKRLQYSFGLASDYMSEKFKVNDFRDLPSDNMLMQLSAFFYYNNNSQPDDYEKKQIRIWFWYTGIYSRYSGKEYSKNIISDFVYFKKLGEGRQLSYNITERVPRSIITISDYTTGSSLNKAFYLMLAMNEPKYLEGGGNIPVNNYVSLKNKINKHHIFPKDFLKRRGVGKNKINSLANICFLVFKENLDIKNHPPVKYLDGYRRKNYYRRFLSSHLIPTGADSGLYEKTRKAYDRFILLRANLIAKKFEKLAGVRMFEK